MCVLTPSAVFSEEELTQLERASFNITQFPRDLISLVHNPSHRGLVPVWEVGEGAALRPAEVAPPCGNTLSHSWSLSPGAV